MPVVTKVLNGKSLIAGVVTTAGTVVARVLMGQACDKFGPRYCKHRFPNTRAAMRNDWIDYANITNLVLTPG